MTSFQALALACVLSVSSTSLATDHSRDLTAGNVIRCQANSGCFNKAFSGRSYKVIATPRYTVMLSVSREGLYTRADVSIQNSSGVPLSLSPDDFRVEVVSSKNKVLSYVPFADLKDVAPAPPIPAVEAAAPAPATPTPNIDELYAQAKKRQAEQAAADEAAALQPLAASVVVPDQTVRGRVYFDQDKHAHELNVILPIAGLVFEFPYTLK